MNIRIRAFKSPFAIELLLIYLFGMAACGGGGGSAPPAPPPPGPTIQTISVAFASEDVIAGSTETGTVSAELRYNVTDSELEATVTLSNVAAEIVSLRTGYAGSTGAELYPLAAGSNADEWTLDASPLAMSDVDALETGALYLTVTTAAFPDGALRGQVLPTGIDVARFELSANQVTSNSNSMASGKIWLTIDSNSNEVTVNLVTSDITDASAAEIREAAAGEVGPVLFDLSQSTSDTDLWQQATTAFSTDAANAANDGKLYASVSTVASPDGAIRGQLVPDGIELVITDLSSDALVMSGAMAASRMPLGRAMTTIKSDTVTSNVNLFSVAGADSAVLRRAPAGQNGPVLASYVQDINDPDLWSLRDYAIDAAVAASIDNRTLYIQVTTPTEPDGAARGQVETADSQLPPDPSAFVVVSISPPNAAEVAALPQNVIATLNRPPLHESITAGAVSVEASGGDGSFGDGNEVSITPAMVSANGVDIDISLAGIPASDDVYRVSLIGGGAAGIVDQSGIPLDGDNDGEPGGTFEAAFELTQPQVAGLFSQIQQTIFTPTCATTGCHSGAGAPDGLRLTAGQAYSNTVNVASVQMPSLMRIKPGDPDNSYLVRKVEGSGIAANRMPLGQAPLSQQEIDLIRQWVTEGAEND